MLEITCPYQGCGNKFAPADKDLVYEKLGRKVECPKCKRIIHLTRRPVLNTGKVHMSKKARLRIRREAAKESGLEK